MTSHTAKFLEVLELSAAQKHELDRRLAAYERDADAGVPWAELKARLLAGGSKGATHDALGD